MCTQTCKAATGPLVPRHQAQPADKRLWGNKQDLSTAFAVFEVSGEEKGFITETHAEFYKRTSLTTDIDRILSATVQKMFTSLDWKDLSLKVSLAIGYPNLKERICYNKLRN